MPLKRLDNPHYLDRFRLMTDVDEREPTESRSTSQYTIKFAPPIQNVVSFEVSDFALPDTLASTFVGRYNSRYPGNGTDTQRSPDPGNAVLDMVLSDPTQTDALYFSLDMEDFIGTGVSLVSANISDSSADALRFILLAQAYHKLLMSAGISALITNAYVFTYTTNLDNTVLLSWEDGFSNAAPVELPNATGTHASDSAARVWGFDEGVDTVFQPVSLGALSPHAVQPMAHRYVDINLAFTEDQLGPTARVFLKDKTSLYVQPCEQPRSARWLNNNFRRLERIRVRLLYEGGKPVPSFLSPHHAITYQALALTQDTLPDWLKIEIGY